MKLKWYKLLPVKQKIVGSSPIVPTIYWYISSVLYTVERVIGYMWVQSPLPVLYSPIANRSMQQTFNLWGEVQFLMGELILTSNFD